MWKVIKKIEYAGGVTALIIYFLCVLFCMLMKYEIIKIQSLEYIDWHLAFHHFVMGGAMVTFAAVGLFGRKIKSEKESVKTQSQEVISPEEIVRKAKLNADLLQKRKKQTKQD